MEQGVGLINFVGNADLVKQEEDDRKKAAEEAQSTTLMTNLTAYLKTCLDAAKRFKKPIETRLANCERRRNGEYAPDKLMRIKEHGGSEIFMMLTDVKCAAFESIMLDIQFPPGERPWAIDATPAPDLPADLEGVIKQRVDTEVEQARALVGQVDPAKIQERLTELKNNIQKEIREEAEKAARRQEFVIDDVLVEGNWYTAIKDGFIHHLATYPTAFLEGPVVRKRKVRVWKGTVAGIEEKFVREFDAISPWDFFPSAGMKDPDNGYFFIRYDLTRSQLLEMVDVPGYNTEAIRLVLDRYGKEGIKEPKDVERTENSTIPTKEASSGTQGEIFDPEGNIVAYKFRGSVQGKLLREYGMDTTEIPDELNEYEVEAWLVGEFTIKCVLNEHPLKKRYLYCSSFRENPNSIWGKAIAEVMKSSQDMCNASARAISNNEAAASGPSVEWNIERLAPDQEVTEVYPRMVIQTINDPSGKNTPSLRFYQPDNNVQELLRIYDYFFHQASEETAIPNYTYGQTDVPGAGKTMGGLAMLMNASNRGMKRVVGSADSKVVEPSVTEVHYHLVDYGGAPAYAGDIKIRARASNYLIQLEQLQVRLSEAMQITANPFDMQIMGAKGRAFLLREWLRLMKINADKVIPNDVEAEQAEFQKKVGMILEAISKQLNVPVQLLLQAISNQGQQSGDGSAPIEKPTEKNPAGQTAGGKDFAQFNQLRMR